MHKPVTEDEITSLHDLSATDLIAGWYGNPNPLAPTIPETVYICFQLTFAIITPALIAGAFAERMKFSAMMWFMGIWSVVIYAPIAHMMWEPSGYWAAAGVLDFAGGTVVHINAGIAALVCALVLGKRIGYGKEAMMPFNLSVFFSAMLIVKFYNRLTPQQIGRYGFILCTAALLWLAFVVHNDWSELKVLIGLVLFGIGQGSLVTLLFNVLVTSSFVSAFKSPLVSLKSQTFGGSPTSTPWSSTFSARGRTRPSAKTVRLSILPSLLTSPSHRSQPSGTPSLSVSALASIASAAIADLFVQPVTALTRFSDRS